MSQYLLFESDTIDQPAAADPIERLSWCSLRIRIGHQFPSKVWDKTLQCERNNLYLPIFSVAEWLVQNWWSLFNELCPTEKTPAADAGGAKLNWIKRHCLRTAGSALMLPALYLFHDGENLRAEWQKDQQGSLPNMPGEFVADGAEQLETNATQECLANFINDCLQRVRQINDGRVNQLAEHWRAIQGADVEERQFCVLAGRMGIDPYDETEMTEKLAQFLEQEIVCPDDPLVRDLTEVARPDSIEEQWSWLNNVATELGLEPNPRDHSLDIPSRGISPSAFAYELARRVRAWANLSRDAPLDSLEKVAAAVTKKTLRFENRNHVPGQGIRAIVGRSAEDIVCAGPASPREHSQRFLMARGLYHAIVTTQDSPRLVTNAFSWDQKASRAFAAELLAPRWALAERISIAGADAVAIELLSREFQASTMVIENQLENAGILISSE